jgi:hypothetical protein
MTAAALVVLDCSPFGRDIQLRMIDLNLVGEKVWHVSERTSFQECVTMCERAMCCRIRRAQGLFHSISDRKTG